MIIAKVNFVGAGHHAIGIILAEHLAHADLEWLVGAEGGWNDCPWSDPSSKHAFMNIWRAAHNLDITVRIAFNVFGLAAIVDLAEAEVSIWDFLAVLYLNCINFVVFVGIIDNSLDFDESSTNELYEFVVRNSDFVEALF